MKEVVVIGCWVVAATLLLFIAFTIVEPVEKEVILEPLAIGLFVLGFIVDRIWRGD